MFDCNHNVPNISILFCNPKVPDISLCNNSVIWSFSIIQFSIYLSGFQSNGFVLFGPSGFGLWTHLDWKKALNSTCKMFFVKFEIKRIKSKLT